MRLRSPNGNRVSVPDHRVEDLKRQGYKSLEPAVKAAPAAPAPKKRGRPAKKTEELPAVEPEAPESN